MARTQKNSQCARRYSGISSASSRSGPLVAFHSIDGWSNLQTQRQSYQTDENRLERTGQVRRPNRQKISGVETDTIQLPTRLHQWRIEKCTVKIEPTERRNAKRTSGSVSDREAAFAVQPPWSSSSVNNCT